MILYCRNLALALALVASSWPAFAVGGRPPAASSPVPSEEFPIPDGFAGGYREIDGINLHYVKGGHGPLVFLVHGFGQTWYEWHQLMPLLARNHTVVVPDLPGLGLSDPPKTSYAGQPVSEILYKLAKSFSPDTKFDLVAHDIGVWNTYPMAVLHQSDIRRLIYMEAPIPDKTLYEFPAFTPQGESLVWHFSLFTAGDELAETLVTGHVGFFFEHFIKFHATQKEVFTPALLDLYAHSYAKPASLHAAFEYYRALNETERRDRALFATKLTMPVMIVTGGGNGGFGTFEANQMKNYALNIESHILPGCGHWLPEECPIPLNHLIVEFLDRN